MRETLQVLLPRLIAGRAEWKVIDHGSKARLLRDLPQRLRGYRGMAQTMDLRVLVLVDRDRDDCTVLKARLEDMAARAGLGTRSAPDPTGLFHVVNRIVVEELEAWFFGDLPALRTVYPKVSQTLGAKPGYRDPDAIRGGTWEALHRALRQAGYFGDHLPKIELARAVAPHMNLENNRSTSFHAFRQGLESLLASAAVRRPATVRPFQPR